MLVGLRETGHHRFLDGDHMKTSSGSGYKCLMPRAPVVVVAGANVDPALAVDVDRVAVGRLLHLPQCRPICENDPAIQSQQRAELFRSGTWMEYALQVLPLLK